MFLCRLIHYSLVISDEGYEDYVDDDRTVEEKNDDIQHVDDLDDFIVPEKGHEADYSRYRESMRRQGQIGGISADAAQEIFEMFGSKEKPLEELLHVRGRFIVGQHEWFLQPNYWLGHPRHYLFSLSAKTVFWINVSEKYVIIFWKQKHWALSAVLFQPRNRLGHHENYLFSLSQKTFSGSNYPKKYFI